MTARARRAAIRWRNKLDAFLPIVLFIMGLLAVLLTRATACAIAAWQMGVPP